MSRHRSIAALVTRLLALALALTLPGVAAAAGAVSPRSDRVEQTELDEVTVEGRRERQRKPQQSFDWLARLVGAFTIDGSIQSYPHGASGDISEAHGHAVCVGFGIAPGVLCDLQVRWPEATDASGGPVPGGVSTLDPAVMLLGFNLGAHADPMRSGRHYAASDPDSYTIAHFLVDNTGVAEGGAGFRAGTDTMTSRAPCVAIPIDCQRMVQISAPDDLQTIQMRIDLEIQGDVATRYEFVLRRDVESEAVVFGRKPEKEPQPRRRNRR